MGIEEVVVILASLIFSLLVINKRDGKTNEKRETDYRFLSGEKPSMTNKPPAPPPQLRKQYTQDEHFQVVSPPPPPGPPPRTAGEREDGLAMLRKSNADHSSFLSIMSQIKDNPPTRIIIAGGREKKLVDYACLECGWGIKGVPKQLIVVGCPKGHKYLMRTERM